ncbi:MAG: hypothetical protein V7K98_17645 [Nostoc sp.]
MRIANWEEAREEGAGGSGERSNGNFNSPLCPMPNVQCPMPNAQCPIFNN